MIDLCMFLNVLELALSTHFSAILEVFKSEAKAEAEVKAVGKHHECEVKINCFRFLTFFILFLHRSNRKKKRHCKN
jgi:hypothetical protein